MPLAPGPPPQKLVQYIVLHLAKHSNLVKKCAENWYWCNNFGKFFHNCESKGNYGHQLEIHEYGDLGCYHCGKQLPDSLKMIQNLQKLGPMRRTITADFVGVTKVCKMQWDPK